MNALAQARLYVPRQMPGRGGDPATPYQIIEGGNLRTLAERDRDPGINVFEKIPPQFHSDIMAGVPTTDVSGWMQDVAELGRDLLIPPGLFDVGQYGLSLKDGQRVKGSGYGTRLRVGPTSDLSRSAILKWSGFDQALPSTYKGGGGIDGVEIYFDQTHATLRSDLIDYPWAMDIRQNHRFETGNIRIIGCTKGINASAQVPGWYWNLIQMSTFGIGIDIGDTGDFSQGNRLAFWCYGFGLGEVENGADLLDIYQDGQAIALRVGRCDGLSISSITSYGQKIVFTNAGGPGAAKKIGMIQLDGNQAVMEDAAPNLQVDQFSSTKNTALPNPPTGPSYKKTIGVTEFGDFRTFGFNDASDDVQVSGGIFIAANVNLAMKSTGRSALVTSGTGRAILNGGWLDPGTSAIRTEAYLRCDGGALDAQNLIAVGIGLGVGTLIKVANDNSGNHIHGNQFGGWAYEVPFGFRNGNYGPNRVKPFNWTPTPGFTLSNGTFVPIFDSPEASNRVGTYWYTMAGCEFAFYVAFSMGNYTGVDGNFVINGLPFAPVNYPLAPHITLGPKARVSLDTLYTELDAYIGGTGIQFRESGSGQLIAPITALQLPSGRNGINLSGRGILTSL